MDIIVLGDGGHSKVIQEMIRWKEGYQIIAILDDKYELVHKNHSKMYGPLSYLSTIITATTMLVIAIGDNRTRKTLSQKLVVKESQFLSLVHPSAVVSPSARISYGTVVMPGAYINAGTKIKEHCIINTGAIIEHDTTIDHFSHISPNATVTGNVSIGEGVHIGASATIIPGVNIGKWSVVGAGSTVIHSIPSYRTAVGCPTRIVSKQGEENYKDKAVM